MDAGFWRDCTEVEIDQEKLHGEPTVGPYRVAARTVIEGAELGEKPEEIADEYQLPLDTVRSILAYFHAHQPELKPSS